MPKLNGLGFADIEIQNRFKEITFYDKINMIINWKPIEKILKKYTNRNKDALGNPAYPSLKMFKLLLVQKWEKLSDYQAEFALKDRISVIKFVGYSISDPVPDHSTICRFRQKIQESGCYEELLEEINNQLRLKGFQVKGRKESVVDATVVKSSRRPRKTISSEKISNDRAEGSSSEESSEVESCNEEENNVEYSEDQEASWLKKGKKYYYGYKAFAVVDIEGYFIGGMVKGANVNESKEFSSLLSKIKIESGSRIYCDKGYSSKSNRELLKERGYKDFIMHKKVRNGSISEFMKKLNRYISSKRFVVEQFFGILKSHYGLERFRYIGSKKGEYELYMCGICCNLKKASNLIL